LQRDFEISRKQREVSRKRRALEAQAASLQAELVTVDREAKILRVKAKKTRTTTRVDQAGLAKSRAQINGDAIGQQFVKQEKFAANRK